jgi:hypothetical protein
VRQPVGLGGKNNTRKTADKGRMIYALGGLLQGRALQERILTSEDSAELLRV